MRNGLRPFCLILLCAASGAWGCMKLEQQPGDESAPPKSADQSWSSVRVFYGTDRARTGLESWNSYYGVQPGELEYGCCEVSIPDSHEYGEIERPEIWKLEFRESPDRHVMLQNIEPQSRADFLSLMQDDLQKTPQKEVFVFVHGYNVTFAQAAYRTAQMAYDLKFPGPPMMFSWPSQGALTGYIADMTAADQAREHLKQFLETVALDSGARHIHLIVHSMGNRIITEVLRDFAEQTTGPGTPHFQQIVLAAPDVDAEVFKREIAPLLASTADRITIYASSNDRALQASQLVHQRPRLGQGGEHLTTFPEQPYIDVVDASWVDFRFFDLGHAEYGDALLADVRQTLTGQAAPQRGLMPHYFPQAWTVPAEPPLLAVKERIQTAAHEQAAGSSRLELNSPETSSTPVRLAAFWKSWWQSLFQDPSRVKN